MTDLFRNKYRIASTRLPGYNYSQPGWYFVTICTKNRWCYFGHIVNGHMVLSDIGEMVANEWVNTYALRKNVSLDEWVVMPNHVHGIVVINTSVSPSGVETHCNASLRGYGEYKNTFGPQRNNLSSIIRGFKGATTKRINQKYGTNHFAWQERFYERIIRDERASYAVRQYIRDNPEKWWRDRNNTEGIFM